MADIKFLDSNGLSVIAGYVNKKLDKVTEMPANPPDAQTVLYIGATGAYTKGHLYQYSSTSSNWADITPAPEPAPTPTPSAGGSKLRVSSKPKMSKVWSPKIWTGLSEFLGYNIWTDGTNIYYSQGATQYVLDPATSTWSPKTWTGLSGFHGEAIWTDGTNIYYSLNSQQYVLDPATSTWSRKTWQGLEGFNGDCIWTDGTNIYYSNGSSQYVLSNIASTRS